LVKTARVIFFTGLRRLYHWPVSRPTYLPVDFRVPRGAIGVNTSMFSTGTWMFSQYFGWKIYWISDNEINRRRDQGKDSSWY